MPPSPVPDGPGVLLLNEDLTVAAATWAAEYWLAELVAMGRVGPHGLPHAVVTVVGRLRSREVGPGRHAKLQPTARLRTAAG